MKQRGRKGIEGQTAPVVRLPGQRPEPPEYLSSTEAEVWRAVVATKPSDWFTPDVFPLLADYCTACVQQDLVRKSLHKCKHELERGVGIKALDKLAKLKASLATKMRLTPQSRYTPQAAATAARDSGPSQGRPWGAATGTSPGSSNIVAFPKASS